MVGERGAEGVGQKSVMRYKEIDLSFLPVKKDDELFQLISKVMQESCSTRSAEEVSFLIGT